MRGRDSNDALTFGCLFLLISWFVVRGLAEKFGAWVWPTSILFLAGSFYVATTIQRERKAWEERKQRAKPCSHGTVGAALKPIVCWQCTNEAEQRETAKRARAAAELAKRLADRQRKIEEFRASVRAPSYLQQVDPRKFEKIVCLLFQKMGYEVEETPYVADGGIDGFLRRDGQVALLQCKRVQGSVSEPVIRDLWGNIQHHRASEGVVVTTGKVSGPARSWAQGKPIRIIELDELVNLIRQYLTEKAVVPDTFIAPSTSDEEVTGTCPKCGRHLRRIKGKNGPFFGCSGYPDCRYSQSIPGRGAARRRFRRRRF